MTGVYGVFNYNTCPAVVGGRKQHVAGAGTRQKVVVMAPLARIRLNAYKTPPFLLLRHYPDAPLIGRRVMALFDGFYAQLLVLVTSKKQSPASDVGRARGLLLFSQVGL
jgi:hypothetical protein